MSRRIDIDLLKTLACLMVAMYHLAGIPYTSAATGSVSPSGYYLHAIMAACVPLFFFASGVLYADREVTLVHVGRKCLRLVGLLVFWALFAGVFFQLIDGSFSLKDALYDAVSLKLLVANWLWFLPVMCAVYLAAPFLSCIRREGGQLWNALVACLCALTFGLNLVAMLGGTFDLLAGSEFGTKVAGFLGNFNLLSFHPEALAFFSVGMWMGGRDLGWLTVPRSLALLVVAPIPLAAYGMLSQSITGAELDVTGFGNACVTTLLVVVALFGLSRAWAERVSRGTLFPRLVVLVASNSLAVYLLHWFLRVPAERLVPRGAPDVVMEITTLALSVVIVVVCALVGRAARRTPLKALLA